MKKKIAFTFLLLGTIFSASLFSAYSYELTEDMTLTLSGDLRIRWEEFNSGVLFPSGGKSGGKLAYYRMRTRVAAKLEMPEGISLQARLANRVHRVSSHFLLDPNNQRTATWNYPDEVVFDQLFLRFDDIADSGFSLTLGRQDLILGNGMIILEGTPFDQGRSLYQDGAVLRYKGEENTVTTFALYNHWKDRITIMNDRDRRLRLGDTFTTGIYWTHNFDAAFNFDLYYIFNYVDDDSRIPMRGHAYYEDLSLHTIGMRLFGKVLDEQLEYSLELAKQAGYCTKEYDDSKKHYDNQGFMLDARIRLHAPKDTLLSPSLGFEYYFASGDDPKTKKNEGWNTLLAEYPRWGEELLPIMLTGVWSNMHFLRTDLDLKFSKDFSGNFSIGNLFADETSRAGTVPLQRTGSGSYMGTIFSIMLDYKFNKYLSLSTKVAKFNPGNYFADKKDGYWGYMQAMLEF